MAVKGIVLDTKVLDRITKELKPKAQKIIAKSAFRVEGKAKMNSPIKFGAHRSSGYTIAPGKNNYGQNTSRARSLNPDALIDAPVKPKNDMSAVVGFPMEYSLYLETGTTRMAARPHLVPAMESEEKPLINDLKKMIK